MSRGMFFYNEGEEQSHEAAYALDSCYLCARPFFDDSEIFMYRGDTAFCSDDCRQEQIEFDEAKERKKQKKVMSIRKSDSDQASPSSDVRHGSIQVA
uniref:FLZ-type domain-containing protein n=1 Tax=Kalanchoe fedtschenkoi TaxID=63787 RepID=A0A7N0UR44_KALFE